MCAFLLIQGHIEMIGGEPLTGANIRVGYDSPDYARAYLEVFHSPVTFNAGSHSMELPKAGLDTPSPFYNAEVWLQTQLFLAKRLKDLTRIDQDTYTPHVCSVRLGTRAARCRQFYAFHAPKLKPKWDPHGWSDKNWLERL